MFSMLPKNETFVSDTCDKSEDLILKVQEPSVTIDKTINQTLSDDDTVVYDVVVTNNGPIPASDVKITDSLPTGFVVGWSAVTRPSGTDPIVDNSTVNLIDISMETLPVGNSNTFRFSAEVDPNFNLGNIIINTVDLVYYSVDQGIDGVREYDGTDSAIFTLPPNFCVTVENLTYDHNADFNSTAGLTRTNIVGAVGDMMRYTCTFSLPFGNLVFKSLEFEFNPYFTNGLEPVLSDNSQVYVETNGVSTPVSSVRVEFDNNVIRFLFPTSLS